MNGKNEYAHRVAYEQAYGPIPHGLNVLHHCDNPSCVEPLHLFLGTIAQNNRDMLAKGRQNNQKKTHCKCGHEFTTENTILIPRGNGRYSRQCRTCHYAAVAEYSKTEQGRKMRRGIEKRYRTKRKGGGE